MRARQALRFCSKTARAESHLPITKSFRVVPPQNCSLKADFQQAWCRSYAVGVDQLKLDVDGLPTSIGRGPKRPKRKFVGVKELVTEFERAMASGARLNKNEATYQNLADEAKRLRRENDEIMSEVSDLMVMRATYVELENEIQSKLEKDGDYSKHGAEKIELLKNIREVDYQIAGLRYQQFVNIQDIGLLKRTMNRIEKMGEVMALVDKVEAALEEDTTVPVDSTDTDALAEQVDGFRTEYDSVTKVVWTYRESVQQKFQEIYDAYHALLDVRETEGNNADEIRNKLVAHLQHMKRMLAQLSRLRDIQVLNAKEIGILERVRKKLRRHAEVQKLLKSGDRQRILDEFARLQERTARLRASMLELETSQARFSENSAEITTNLRELKDVVTAETGNLREQLIANIQEEEQTRERLAVLRSAQVQNIQFLASLKGALLKLSIFGEQ